MTCRNPRGTPPAPAVAWARLGGMSALTCCWRDPWAPLQSGEPGAQAASRSLVNDLATSAADLAGQIDAAASVHRGDRDGGGLDATATLLAAVDRLTAAVITLLQATDHHDVIAEHGVTRDTWLRAIAGRTGGDAGMLLAAAERLADMPLTAWFHQGVLSWGAVRAIVAGGCGRCGSAPSTARPAFLVVADLSALDPDAPVGSGTARLHWATNRSPVEVTPATAQRLPCDATLRSVMTDGTHILGVTAAHPKVGTHPTRPDLTVVPPTQTSIPTDWLDSTLPTPSCPSDPPDHPAHRTPAPTRRACGAHTRAQIRPAPQPRSDPPGTRQDPSRPARCVHAWRWRRAQALPTRRGPPEPGSAVSRRCVVMIRCVRSGCSPAAATGPATLRARRSARSTPARACRSPHRRVAVGSARSPPRRPTP